MRVGDERADLVLGANASGQLGFGMFEDRDEPVAAGNDTTLPSVTPTISPPAGPTGWHTTDFTVTWVVSDPESAITTPPCGVTVVNVDTIQYVVCTATSASGTTSVSVEVGRDATAPVVAVTGVTAGATYPATAVPFPSCTTTDATSGVATPATVTGVVYTGSTGTTYNYSASCGGAVDRAGNAAPTVAVAYSVTNSGGRPAELAGGTVLPDGTVTTDASGAGPDATDGLDTTVTSPNGGVVTISEQPAVAPPPVGYATLGVQVQITAPPASADEPLRIVFDIDASMIIPPDTKDTIAIFRNGGPALTDCLGASQVPDEVITAGRVACVAGRDNVPAGGSDVRITVITTTASLWQLAVPSGPTITLGRGSVAEGTTGLDRKIFVPVTLSEPAKTTVVVNYQVQETGAPGSATAGSDFVAAQGKVTFKPTTTGNTATTKWVAVRVKPDDRAEGTEDIRVVVTGVTGGGYSLDSTPGVATILDDDATPGVLGVSIAGGAISEGDHAYPKYNVAKLTLALTQPASVDTTVTLEISGGSATSNIDYKAWNNKIPQRKTITFKPGQFQKPIAMNVLADLITDPGEFVTIKIISATGNTTVLHNLATLTITDDD